MTNDYISLLSDLKRTVRDARTRAIRKVNRSVMLMYWDIGRQIVLSQQKHGWGKEIVERLSKDLISSFPGQTGMSPSNLWRMRQFYLLYEGNEELAQAVREIPWGHNVVLLSSKFTMEERLFYARQSASIGWTRAVLEYHIDANLYKRSLLESPTNNFRTALPDNLLAQANEAIKNSYTLEFLGVRKEISEADLEKRLVSRIRDFLLELGQGFTFVGRQYRVSINDSDFWVDLLFYHRNLQCLIAIDLKVTRFKPEYAGKMNFYLNVLDDRVRLPHENQSIGIILCKEKDDVVVEYALAGQANPIGVSVYRLFNELPAEVRQQLPTPEQLRIALVREEE